MREIIISNDMLAMENRKNELLDFAKKISTLNDKEFNNFILHNCKEVLYE